MPFRAFCEMNAKPGFNKSTLKPDDRTEPYYVLVHRQTNQILKNIDDNRHAPGLNHLRVFTTREYAERYRYSLASRMNDYVIRRMTSQLFTDTNDLPDHIVINPGIANDHQ